MQNINKQRLRQSRASGSVYIVIPSITDRYSQVTIVTQNEALDSQGIICPRDYRIALENAAKSIEHKHQKIENNHDFCGLMLQACLQYIDKQPVTRDLQLLRLILIKENKNHTVFITVENDTNYQIALGILRKLIQQSAGDPYTVQALIIAQKRVTQRHAIFSTIQSDAQKINFNYLKRNADIKLLRLRLPSTELEKYLITYNQANNVTGWFQLKIHTKNVLIISPTQQNIIKFRRVISSLLAGNLIIYRQRSAIKIQFPKNGTNTSLRQTIEKRDFISNCYLNSFSCFSNPNSFTSKSHKTNPHETNSCSSNRERMPQQANPQTI